MYLGKNVDVWTLETLSLYHYRASTRFIAPRHQLALMQTPPDIPLPVAFTPGHLFTYLICDIDDNNDTECEEVCDDFCVGMTTPFPVFRNPPLAPHRQVEKWSSDIRRMWRRAKPVPLALTHWSL